MVIVLIFLMGKPRHKEAKYSVKSMRGSKDLNPDLMLFTSSWGHLLAFPTILDDYSVTNWQRGRRQVWKASLIRGLNNGANWINLSNTWVNKNSSVLESSLHNFFSVKDVNDKLVIYTWKEFWDCFYMTSQ